jgi:hypothetical protein
MEAEAEEKQRLTVQTLQHDPGPTQRALGQAPNLLRKEKLVKVDKLAFSLTKMNPTLTNGERAFINGQ